MGAALKRAIGFAHPGDKIIALHIPTILPEMMLSSMNDPGETSLDTFSALAGLPEKAGEAVQNEMKEAAEKELKSTGKDVELEFRVSAPASDLKTRLLSVCKTEKASMLLIGPGAASTGSLPPFLAAHAKGLTLCVVRDHVE